MYGNTKEMSVFIIAEAGVNHNGSLELAKEMIDMAKLAGVDCIKFQTFQTEDLVSRYASKAEYQKVHTDSDESQFDMLKKLELSFNDFIVLKEYCERKDIEFMSTAFGMDSINFLENLGIKRLKIPSGEITNLPYLIKIAKLNKPIIMSTGMSTLKEIEFACSILTANGANDVTLLHCTTDYPAPFEDVNLNAIKTIKDKFNLPVGYSDHTLGVEVTIAAVAMGATVIEKHFTLDNNMSGPDHMASLEPAELNYMVKAIRNVEIALGKDLKVPSCSEMKNMEVARKSIIAKSNIKQGDFFTENNLTIKRPGTGISPMKWFDILGKRAIKDFKEDELIEL